MARPWAKRAEELFERDGMWSDFAAWGEWIDSRTEHLGDGDGEIRDRLHGLQEVQLYVLCCELADAADAKVDPTA